MKIDLTPAEVYTLTFMITHKLNDICGDVEYAVLSSILRKLENEET